MIYVLMLLGGLALASFNTWQRLGRSAAARRWARGTHRDFAQRNVLVLWPALAVALLGGALLGAAERLDLPTWPGVLLVALGLVTWLAFAALPLPVPAAVQPRWYREQVGPRRRSARD
ncbi:hypothetical protein ASC64_12630 [Nocardioides sp. Root122]|uniref:hypothetical protein n=1 Tax=Nocardioides TaxID=1839 RepID=UPI000703AF1D|nr:MULTISPECIES: hypothetical protein [Nocardioides]KQV65751.1 hypothetical protein ASC64_12630 [Nocardioides sp. Root122]MCK9823342.1 hypothetical protein [Nocardioides cavernae]